MVQLGRKTLALTIAVLLGGSCVNSLDRRPAQSQDPSQQDQEAEEEEGEDDRSPGNGTPLSFAAFQKSLLQEEPNLDDFADFGPFPYEVKENLTLSVSKSESIVADAALAEVGSKAPLVILVHGNHSKKEAHRYQAEHLASWGINALVLQLPNRAQWLQNGRRIARIVSKICKRPQLVGPMIDKRTIILAGHSFGGSAVTIAAGRGAPVKGLILLDPAVVSSRVEAYMKKVDEPVMLLGSDRTIYRSRKRSLFFKSIRGEMAEISVRGATHDDAQYPSMFSLAAFGFDPYTSRDKQRLFAAAITLTSISIAAKGNLDYAWKALADEVRGGGLKSPRRRAKQELRSRSPAVATRSEPARD